MIRVKRVYEKFDITDGTRILVERLWPRGVRKNTPNIDMHMKDVAPSNELRKWYAHDPAKWESFKVRYRKELDENPSQVSKLIEIVATNDTVTFVYAASDPDHNSAIFLAGYINEKLKHMKK